MNIRLLNGLLSLLAVTVTVAGCSGRPARVHPPAIDAEAAGTAAMNAHDKNRDGRVSGDEFDTAPALKAAEKRLDSNGDGGVDAQEVTARIKAWQKSRVGMMPYLIKISLDGEPLAGADVTMEPAAFLGDEIQPAFGVTDEHGLATLSVAEGHRPEPRMAGVHCGLYCVRISKKNEGQETLPDKFNVETTLGVEAAIDLSNQTGITDLNLER